MPRLARGVMFTRRAIAVLVVFALLTISYASSLRIYLSQQHDIAVSQAAITDAQARIDDLNDKITRWDDPAYVKAQARDRLGWVVPGETGYVVIGPDGRPIPGSSALTADRGLDASSPMSWWQRLWDSFVTADQPVRLTAPGGNVAPPAVPTAQPTK